MKFARPGEPERAMHVLLFGTPPGERLLEAFQHDTGLLPRVTEPTCRLAEIAAAGIQRVCKVAKIVWKTCHRVG